MFQNFETIVATCICRTGGDEGSTSCEQKLPSIKIVWKRALVFLVYLESTLLGVKIQQALWKDNCRLKPLRVGFTGIRPGISSALQGP